MSSTRHEHERMFLVSFAVAAVVLIFFAGSAHAGCAGAGESGKNYGYENM